MFFYAITITIIFFDQLIKYWVTHNLALGQSILFLGNILKLTYVQNTGAAFSLFVGFSSYLALIGIVVSIIILYVHHRAPSKDYYIQFALASILGGSLGNLIDRLLRSYVIDYLDITVWPVFNLADIMINVGVILLAYRIFKEEENLVSLSL